MPKGVFVVQSGPASPEQEAAYNDWYTNTHIPELLAVPGFVGARRYKVHGDAAVTHPYLTIYEIDADDVAAPMQEYRRRSDAGQTQRSDTIRLDPPPITALYELVE